MHVATLYFTFYENPKCVAEGFYPPTRLLPPSEAFFYLVIGYWYVRTFNRISENHAKSELVLIICVIENWCCGSFAAVVPGQGQGQGQGWCGAQSFPISTRVEDTLSVKV